MVAVTTAAGVSLWGAARSAVVTCSPISVPCEALPPMVWAAEVYAGPEAIAALTSRSMTRPCGPEPSVITAVSIPFAPASTRARGETAPDAVVVANDGAAGA